MTKIETISSLTAAEVYSNNKTIDVPAAGCIFNQPLYTVFVIANILENIIVLVVTVIKYQLFRPVY